MKSVEDTFQALSQMRAFDPDLEKRKLLMLEAMNSSFRHHFLNCPPYRNFCQRRGLTDRTKFSALEEIPPLPVQAFKEYGDHLITLDESGKIKTTLNSSATSGRPSVVQIDKMTARRQVLCMARVMEAFTGGKRMPFIIVDADPSLASPGAMGARAAAVGGFLNLASEAHYVLKQGSDGLELDTGLLEKVLDDLAQRNERFVVFGFTYVLYEQVLSHLDKLTVQNARRMAKIIHIGGWKKLEDKKISRPEFNLKAASAFGVTENDVIDIYGFTEQMGIIYPSAGEEDKTCSIFSEVIVRDPSTNEVLPPGQEGLLEFVTPMPTSYPGIAVTTDDLGVITGHNTDPSVGPCGTRFRILGRAKNAEIRGCGDIMSEYISGAKKVEDTTPQDTASEPVLLFSKDFGLDPAACLRPLQQDKLPKVESLEALADEVKKARAKLDKYSVDELIAFLSHVAQKWIEPDSPLIELKQQGLSFLANWLNSSNLRAMADESLRGSRGYLDGFKPVTGGARMLRANARGLVVHWLAGNVPLLGMLVLAQSIVTKNANILKAPSSSTGIMPALMKIIADTDYKLPSGKMILGRDIAETVAVVYFPRDDAKSARLLSQNADVRVAWGGAEAIRTVISLPKKVHTEDIIFGPKLSYMVIGREILDNERGVRRYARKAATDASVFDQYACASPHTIFVECGSERTSPKEFAELLSAEMEKAAQRLPKGETDAGTAGQIHSVRMLYEFTEDVWASSGTTWTVLYDDKGETGLAEPTYSRVITVRAIDDIMKAAEFSSYDIQTIGIGLEGSRRIEFANRASTQGTMRFPEIGRMTHFDTPWDGLYAMSRLVRWTSLGGPLV